jgi:hypothetical protein
MTTSADLATGPITEAMLTNTPATPASTSPSAANAKASERGARMSRLLSLLDRLPHFLLDRLLRSVLDHLHPGEILRDLEHADQHPTTVLRIRASPRVARFLIAAGATEAAPPAAPEARAVASSV